MTTIAVNRTSIACDRQFTYNGNVKMQGKTKIFDVSPDVCKEFFNTDRMLIGFAGDAGEWGDVVNYLCDPSGKVPRIKGIELLALTGKREILYATSLTDWMKIEDKVWAIGTGMQYALGALHLGKTPLEACKVASKFDVSTGMGFKEYTL